MDFDCRSVGQCIGRKRAIGGVTTVIDTSFFQNIVITMLRSMEHWDAWLCQILSKSVQQFVRNRVFFDYSRWWPLPSWILKFLIFYWQMGSEHRDASPIQISSKSVNALWRYNDFMIFQYDYYWPFGPQNCGPHFTHTSALMVRTFWSAFYPLTVCHVRRSAFYTSPASMAASFDYFKNRIMDANNRF